jgi:hypothetical protein
MCDGGDLQVVTIVHLQVQLTSDNKVIITSITTYTPIFFTRHPKCCLVEYEKIVGVV